LNVKQFASSVNIVAPQDKSQDVTPQPAGQTLQAGQALLSAGGSTLPERIFLARLELSALLGERVSQGDLGSAVAKRLGKNRPISAATVSRWESGAAVPTLGTLEAIAQTCGVDPGWLGFGEKSAAPPPRSYAGRAGEIPAVMAMLSALRRLGSMAPHEHDRTKEQVIDSITRLVPLLQELYRLPPGPERDAMWKQVERDTRATFRTLYSLGSDT
jgi:transcriptional regulator with XRE-family HTH domain